MLGNSVLSCWSAGSLLQCFHMQLIDNIWLLLQSPSLSPQLCAEVFLVTRFILLALEVFIDSVFIEVHNEWTTFAYM